MKNMVIRIGLEVLIGFGLVIGLGIYHSRYHAKHADVIMPLENTMQVKEVVKTLREMPEGSKMILHITGEGGSHLPTLYFLNAINNTKADVIASVEGPAYSAHALIACAADGIKMSPYSFLMFHTTSLYGEDCSQFEGKLDRGQDAVEKCEQDKEMLVSVSNQIIDNCSILTAEEKGRIKQGYDVYITADQIIKRQL